MFLFGCENPFTHTFTFFGFVNGSIIEDIGGKTSILMKDAETGTD